ncbi:sulfite exporter TauE/SafE family protein [Candidimonas sp. SYP-B2681]|nr:sulfite exporter TauE/SafE family protein [Candidimonas sp. SYP-B2681]
MQFNWPLLSAVFVLAGIVKGVVGLGLPTVAIGLLALVMPPAEAAALLILPSLFTNVWQAGPRTLWPVLKRLAPMQAGIVVGTIGGAWLIGAPAGAWSSILLGVALIAYAVWGLWGSSWTCRPSLESRLGLAVGAATGIVTAATGVFAIPAVPYLQALSFDRDALIQAMGLCFTTSTLALAAGLVLNNSLSIDHLGISMLMLLPCMAGMIAGQMLRSRLSPPVFKRCFLISLVLLGVHMVARELL